MAFWTTNTPFASLEANRVETPGNFIIGPGQIEMGIGVVDNDGGFFIRCGS